MPTLFLKHGAKSSVSHLLMICVVASLGLVACGKKEEAAPQGAGMVMPVSVISVKSTSVPITAEAVAQTEGAKEVEIRPRVGGILLKRMYDEGASVKAGQTMFLIDPAPYQIALQQAKAAYSAQQARVEQAVREEARLRTLLATQSISQREYDNASSDKATSQANLQQALANVREAELNLSYTNVTSPLTGVSGRFQFSEGALVSPNTSLLTTVSQISPIWVRFSLSDSEIKVLGGHLTEKNIKQVAIVLPDGSEYKQKGKLNFSASQIDPKLGTQQLRATFENSEHQLLPGQFVRARITTGVRNGVFLIPQTAVLTSDQGKFVFVADKDNAGKVVAAVRPIKEGGWLGNDWVVLEGLKEGDQVIADNLIKVRPGAPVNPHPFGTAPAMPAANPAKAK
ncbi:efflux RND transporter periplasmic adaptor subunit [Candidatus Methylopumilus turicensis]|uniref:Efflux transporter, RND family, MFP subunit n=1 Tax=Candidatus Methylopumilus turicensis TaxID=1581680 RepID=A0A0B7IZC6_9PROT|nr:efflux RND transporter periplasmic adaptor subunit [Candidatus Methylopumilus turicensis]CEN55871.1 Efflux transporter, RND family, MFP subunit [Candidatus Methylopumilus turicensis]